MNNDLISRSELKEAFKAWKTMDDYYHNTDCNDIPFSEAYDLIDNAPTVETYYTNDDILEAEKEGYERGKSERPKGEWKRHDEWRNGEYIGGFYHVNCPCEDGYYSRWETNFCPNCGADMRKGGAENEI